MCHSYEQADRDPLSALPVEERDVAFFDLTNWERRQFVIDEPAARLEHSGDAASQLSKASLARTVAPNPLFATANSAILFGAASGRTSSGNSIPMKRSMRFNSQGRSVCSRSKSTCSGVSPHSANELVQRAFCMATFSRHFAIC